MVTKFDDLCRIFQDFCTAASQASPRKAARRRPTVTIVGSSTRPITSPNRLRAGVCALSTMICERFVSPLCWLGSSVTRSSGASVASGAKTDRVQLRRALAKFESGDVLMGAVRSAGAPAAVSY